MGVRKNSSSEKPVETECALADVPAVTSTSAAAESAAKNTPGAAEKDETRKNLSTFAACFAFMYCFAPGMIYGAVHIAWSLVSFVGYYGVLGVIGLEVLAHVVDAERSPSRWATALLKKIGVTYDVHAAIANQITQAATVFKPTPATTATTTTDKALNEEKDVDPELLRMRLNAAIIANEIDKSVTGRALHQLSLVAFMFLGVSIVSLGFLLSFSLLSLILVPSELGSIRMELHNSNALSAQILGNH